MSNSALVDYTKISPNSNNPRKDSIKKITIHHMAGDLTIEACGDGFAKPSRQASANYGIGSDGRVGMYVEENRRAWTSSSPANDNQAVTIEVANDGGAPDWHVSDKALNKLIELCLDVCKRNGIKQLNYTGDVSGNLTRHNMFVATSCPGPYLQGKLPYIAGEVNKRLTPAGGGGGTAPATALRKGDKGDAVKTLQASLQKLGYSPGVADGIFGALTEESVIAFQRAAGITADGIAGPATQEAIAKRLAPPDTGKIYRVQVGAFSVKANADKLVAELKAKGYSAVVV